MNRSSTLAAVSVARSYASPAALWSPLASPVATLTSDSSNVKDGGARTCAYCLVRLMLRDSSPSRLAPHHPNTVDPPHTPAVAMSFARLPAELQIHIFSYLQAPELKAVRAVCTQFRDNASIWLFRQVIACARYPVMGVFQRITNHAVYSTCVKEIVFDGTVFSADLARSESLYQHAANHFEDLTSLWAKRRG